VAQPLDPGQFPNAATSGYAETSPRDRFYNCIAHAAGERSNDRNWWPDENGYWPPGVPRVETLDAFVRLFRSLGYQPTNNAAHVVGVEKVALYVDAFGWPTHAARQLANGRWTSKVGRNIDIEHGLEALEGGLYGTVARVLERPARPPTILGSYGHP
jgi:hypothetical protein